MRRTAAAMPERQGLMMSASAAPQRCETSDLQKTYLCRSVCCACLFKKRRNLKSYDLGLDTYLQVCEYCNRAKTQPAQIIMAYRLYLLHGVMTARSYHATSLFSSSAQSSVPGVSARCRDRQTRQGKYPPISPRESLHQPVPGC